MKQIDLERLDSTSVTPQEVLDGASSLAGDGDDLIQKSHYAEDSIQPKCRELRAVSETVRGNLRAKKDHLLKAMELHHCLERVRTPSRCAGVVFSVVFF